MELLKADTVDAEVLAIPLPRLPVLIFSWDIMSFRLCIEVCQSDSDHSDDGFCLFLALVMRLSNRDAFLLYVQLIDTFLKNHAIFIYNK